MTSTTAGATTHRAPRQGRRGRSHPKPVERTRASLLMVGILFLTVCLVSLAMLSPILGYLAIAMAMMITLLTIVGTRRIGFAMMVAAFATAPMYKGLALTHGAQITPTDILIVFGFMAMIGRMVNGRIHAPVDYRVSAIVLFVFGCVGTLSSPQSGKSMLSLILWVAAFALLPIGLATLSMTTREVKALAWAYVGGQVFDTLYAAAHDHGRWMGLSGHPNNFAEFAVYAICLLTWLHRVADARYRWVIWAIGLMQVGAVFESGSRAATLALAALVLIYPIIERSTKAAVGVVASGAVAAVALGYLLAHASSDSALGRLSGAGNSSGSDLVRAQGLHTGWQSFLAHPLTGSGLTFENLFLIHNGFLEVAVATGVVGFFAYLGLLISFDRVVLLRNPMSRLGYAAIAFSIIGSFEPSLWDRGTWCAVAFGFLAHQYRHEPDVVGSDPVPVPAGQAMRGTPE